ncbi:MAG: DUF2164 family protein [Candidatus Nomurabacteria bacterium]|nr:MAG: DUF2164 family protein [Candidatus Nomurabacteria bacterium]
MKRKWDSEDEALQRKCVNEIITRIDESTDIGVGVIAAQDIIDIVTENLAPEIYNKGLTDAKKIISAKLADIEVDLNSLEQQIG